MVLNNTLEPDALWMLLTPVYSTLVFSSRFFYVLYLFADREKNESILNSDTGISSDSAHSLYLVLCCWVFFLLLSKRQKKSYLLIFFLNVIATKMYIF